jgi:hypothetical protein
MKKLLYTVFSVCTAMIGYHIHYSWFWTIMDFLFAPIAWIKWLICHEVCITIIKHTFPFFFR